MDVKEFEHLDHYVVEAIEWVSAEYNYLEEFKEEISHLKSTSKNYNLRKAAHFLRYIGKAERRAFKFESRSIKSLDKIYVDLIEQTNLDNDLMLFIVGLSEVMSELKIEKANLAKYASWHVGTLDKDFEHLKDEGEEGGEQYHQLVTQVSEDIEEMEKWIRAIEISLNKAKRLLKDKIKFPDLIKWGGDYLGKDENLILFVKEHYSDIEKMSFKEQRHWYIMRLFVLLENLNQRSLVNEANWKVLKKYLPKILQEYKNNVTINGNSLDRISFVEGSLVPFLTKQIPIETALRISYLVLKTRIYLFYIICDNHPDLAHNDIIIFFKYCEKLIKLIKKENINWIYGIDREGRIIALLLYNVLKKMGLAHGIKLYFIHGTKKGDVTFYSKKQKEMIHGKNVLLVDEAIDSEGTIMGIEKVLTPLVGETGKIIPTAPLIFKNRAELLIKYHAIETGMNFRFIDYWGANINFSGLIYDDKGKVKIGQKDISSVSKDYPTNISLARGFRKSLISLAGVIGVYIKEKDNLF